MSYNTAWAALALSPRKVDMLWIRSVVLLVLALMKSGAIPREEKAVKSWNSWEVVGAVKAFGTVRRIMFPLLL